MKTTKLPIVYKDTLDDSLEVWLMQTFAER